MQGSKWDFPSLAEDLWGSVNFLIPNIVLYLLCPQSMVRLKCPCVTECDNVTGSIFSWWILISKRGGEKAEGWRQGNSFVCASSDRQYHNTLDKWRKYLNQWGQLGHGIGARENKPLLLALAGLEMARIPASDTLCIKSWPWKRFIIVWLLHGWGLNASRDILYILGNVKIWWG